MASDAVVSAVDGQTLPVRLEEEGEPDQGIVAEHWKQTSPDLHEVAAVVDEEYEEVDSRHDPLEEEAVAGEVQEEVDSRCGPEEEESVVVELEKTG